MNAPSAAAILRDVENHLTTALALLDSHALGTVAAPHIDLALNYISDERVGLNADSPVARSAG